MEFKYLAAIILLLISENFVTEFGGMVSTSNEIDGDVAIVITNKPVLWTIEFRYRNHEVTKNVQQKQRVEDGPRKYNLKRLDVN